MLEETKKGSVKTMFKKIRYYYLKKHRYLEPYLQDLIADATGLTPYKIDVLIASKEDETRNEFNYFTFMYEGLKYELKDDKLKAIAE